MSEEETKKMFSRIELDKASDSCGFEFADGYGCTFDNIATCYDDRLKLYDFVKQLQEENKQLKDLIDTILNFSFFKEECPLNFSFEDNSKEDKAQDVFYEDEYCENACNDDYRKCWLKYFEKMQELERGGINEKRM